MKSSKIIVLIAMSTSTMLQADPAITVGKEYYGAGVYFRDYTLHSKSEQCKITYDSSFYTLFDTDCIKTSKNGIKTFCTKNKTVCRTEVQIIGKQPKYNSTKRYYESSDRVKWETTFNKHGAVMKTKSETLYLGKSCDAKSTKYGKGKWTQYNGGIEVVFDKKTIWFGRHQEMLIENDGRCLQLNAPIEKQFHI